MQPFRISTFVVIALSFWIGDTIASANGGNVDWGTQDLHAACNSPAQRPNANLGLDRQRAVFAVWVTRSGKFERNGTATLIDDTGIFATAGHVIDFDVNRPIVITQKIDGKTSKYDAKVLWHPNNYQKFDFALLQALNWNNGRRYPYPLRFDDAGMYDGSFFGFEEQSDGPIFKHIQYYKMDSSGGKQYEGMIFGQSSGALLYDEFGRAFAIIVKHDVTGRDSAEGLPQEQLFRDWLKRATVSVFPLAEALPTLKEFLPSSEYMSNLISTLQNQVAVSAIPDDLGRKATSIDLIHLIDEYFSGDIGTR